MFILYDALDLRNKSPGI